MVRGRIGIAAAAVAVIAGGLLAAVGATAAGASSCSAPAGKCYLTTVSPTRATAGLSQQTFSFTVKNESSSQAVGSAEITAPTGFVVTAASPTASIGTNPNGTMYALYKNLGISQGESTTLTVTANLSCSGGGSGWSVQAKQSNQFNGSGNDFGADPASQTSTPVSSCSLKFSAEPVAAVAGQPISSVVGSVPVTPVSVDVLDGNGNPTSLSNVPISIGANQGTSPVTVSGTTSSATSNGVASFSDLIISQTGSGFTLVATSPGITSATSSPFSIFAFQTACAPNCTGTATDPNNTPVTGMITTSSTTTTTPQFLAGGFGGGTFACNSGQPLTDPLSFDLLKPSGLSSDSEFTVSLQFPKPSGNFDLSSVTVCLVTDYQFTTLGGTKATQAIVNGVAVPGYYEGLLPGCPADENGPDGDGDADDLPQSCVLHKSNVGGTVTVTFLAYGDMGARGW